VSSDGIRAGLAVRVPGARPDHRSYEGWRSETVQALEASETHWAMTNVLGLKTDGNTPLMFENPVVASWPPKWDSKSVGTARPGRI